MSEAYGLNCEGVGTDYASIKKALKKGKPVVALMGPGYFTRRGHFMVLIDIDENDNVTVADVGSRTRSAYKDYRFGDYRDDDGGYWENSTVFLPSPSSTEDCCFMWEEERLLE